MGKLTDQVAVVTGASKGIGAAIAKAFAAEGATVVVNYTASQHDADLVVAVRERVARHMRFRVMSRSHRMSNVCSPIHRECLGELIFS
jgi:NAD(P)-dependent dehydrogenase (short-subunit alcohol dehydrogenase family)